MRKRILFILLSFVIAVCCHAQHLTFSGIPIDGTINAFAQKLATKGYKVSRLNPSLNLPNTRMFEGNYMGQKVDLYVSYVKTSKIVYEVKVCYNSDVKSICEGWVEKVRMSIESKYKNLYTWSEGSMTSGAKTLDFNIFNTKDTYLGTISTSVSPVSYMYGGFIIYDDAKNMLKNTNEELDDI